MSTQARVDEGCYRHRSLRTDGQWQQTFILGSFASRFVGRAVAGTPYRHRVMSRRLAIASTLLEPKRACRRRDSLAGQSLFIESERPLNNP